MAPTDRQRILELIHEAHATVEKAYLAHPATKTSMDWLEKRKFLLADLSLHMVQATMQEPVDKELIKRYLYSILTISHDFLPEAGLLATADRVVSTATGATINKKPAKQRRDF